MREILFRGKRLDNGEWVTGYLEYFYSKDGTWKLHCYISIWGKEMHKVDPSTVGQFTGLMANGKRIFEGDLLNGFSYPFLRDNAHDYFAEVVWFENSPAFSLVVHKNPLSAVRGISAGNADYMEDFDESDWEIIGNIYDNPELLGVTPDE